MTPRSPGCPRPGVLRAERRGTTTARATSDGVTGTVAIDIAIPTSEASVGSTGGEVDHGRRRRRPRASAVGPLDRDHGVGLAHLDRDASRPRARGRRHRLQLRAERHPVRGAGAAARPLRPLPPPLGRGRAPPAPASPHRRRLAPCRGRKRGPGDANRHGLAHLLQRLRHPGRQPPRGGCADPAPPGRRGPLRPT
jgi:hypothetical protein